MSKYYFNDGTAQQGPFTLEELQAKNITAETPVWYDGLPDWTTAGQLEELKGILVHIPPPFHAVTPATVEQVTPVIPVEPVAPVTPVVLVTPVTPVASVAPVTPVAPITPVAPAAVSKPASPARSAKKSTAWLSYVLSLLVLGGVGYLVYQDMEKNKDNKTGTITMTPANDSTGHTTMQQTTTEQPTSTTPTAKDTAKTETTTTTTEPATTTPATTTTNTVTPTTTQPTTVTTTKPVVTVTHPTPAEIKAKQLEAQKLAQSKQAEAQKLAQKKADDDKKKLQAAQATLAAAAAKEKDYRNNWPRFITFGKLDYNANGDVIDAFDVPVYNGTNAMLDKVTVKVDYMKKDKKVLRSETIFIYNIPPGAGLNGKAPESKRGNNVKVFITGITSRKLHFCYPANNGNPDDPYLCN